MLDPQDGQRLKLVVTHDIEPSLIESINLVDPVYYDQWVGPCLAEDPKLSACWKATQSFQESLSLFFSFLFGVLVFLGVIRHLVFGFCGWWWL